MYAKCFETVKLHKHQVLFCCWVYPGKKNTHSPLADKIEPTSLGVAYNNQGAWCPPATCLSFPPKLLTASDWRRGGSLDPTGPITCPILRDWRSVCLPRGSDGDPARSAWDPPFSFLSPGCPVSFPPPVSGLPLASLVLCLASKESWRIPTGKQCLFFSSLLLHVLEICITDKKCESLLIRLNKTREIIWNRTLLEISFSFLQITDLAGTNWRKILKPVRDVFLIKL